MITNPKTVPELRFPGFETSWQTGRVDSFLVLQRGFDLTKKNSGEGTFPVYSSSGISYYHDEYKVRSPGIVTGRKGSVGPVFLVNEDFWPHDTSLWVKDFKGNAVEFLYYFLIQFDLTRFDEASSVPTLNRNNVHREQSAIPTLPEQRKIADFLTAVDGRIGQLSQKKALLEDYKKGVMQQLFTQALRFKDDHGNDFPEWEEKKLGEVCRILKGKGLSKADLVEDGVTPCIRYGELYTIYSELIQEPKSRTNVAEKELVLSEENDVIIPASGETHIDIATASCVMSKGIALGGDLNIIRTKLNGVFLAYYLNNACKHAIARVAQGSSVIHLYPDQLKGLSLRFPSTAEQTKIANFLTALDRKIESVAQQIRHTQAFKKGLLQQMFV
jgi:type I restriction enzyme S subunit